MTHTLGPWAIMETYTGALSINVSPQVPIATVGGAGWHLGAQTARANACLIAAAPELLDMCERLLGFAVHHGSPSAVEAGHGMLEAARELLAKAKGQNNDKQI